MDRNRRGHQRLVAALVLQRVARRGSPYPSGQATVEFAIVAVGFLAATAALAALWHALAGGMVVEHAVAVASHHIQAVAPATLADLFLF